MAETTPLLWATGSFPTQGKGSGEHGEWNPQTFQFVRRGTTGGESTNRRVHFSGDLGKDPHSQFCALTGCPPTNAPPDFRYKANERTLYGRIHHLEKRQSLIYQLTATGVNFLLLLQIVIGAVLTGLGEADVPKWVITTIGAVSTVIAAAVVYLKSRGQPMRARMYRDDLEHVLGEVEHSEVMWLGISKNAHGFDGIDVQGDVTVRAEVARLTHLLDKAIRANTANNPDTYSMPVTRRDQLLGTLTFPSLSQIDAAQVQPIFIAPTNPEEASGSQPSAKKGDGKQKDTEEGDKASELDEEDLKKKQEEEDKKRQDEEDKKKKQEEEEKRKKKQEEEDKKKDNNPPSGSGGAGGSGTSGGGAVASTSATGGSSSTKTGDKNTSSSTTGGGTTTTSTENKGKGTTSSTSKSDSTSKHTFSSSTSGGNFTSSLSDFTSSMLGTGEGILGRSSSSSHQHQQRRQSGTGTGEEDKKIF